MIREVLASRLIALLLLVLVHGLNARDTTLVTETFLHTPLLEVIQTFEQKYHCLIAYEESDIEDLFVHRYIDKIPLSQALKDVFENSGLEYQFLDNERILVRKSLLAAHGVELVIRGKVISNEDQRPLPWATIVDSASGRSTYTDQQGHFSLKLFNAPPSGVINIHFLGFANQSRTWSTNENDLFLKMESRDYELIEVLITDELPILKTYPEQGGYQKRSLPTDLPLGSHGMKDHMRMLQLLPGITATNDLSSGLRIRGGDENESLYLLDDIEFYNIDHFFGIFSAFEPNVIDSTSIYLSNFPVEYGGRTSGVVDMHLKEPAGKDLNGQLGIHSLYSLLNIETRLSENSGLLFATRFTNGDISDEDIYDAIFSNTESPRQVSEQRQRLNEVVPFFRFNEALLKWQWRPSPGSSLSATLFRGRDMSMTDYTLIYDGRFENLRSLITEKYKEDLSWENSGFNLSYDHEVSEKWKISLDISGNKYTLAQSIATSLKVENPRIRDSLELFNSVENSIEGGAVKWQNTLMPFKGHRFDLGASVESHRTASIATNQDTTLQNRLDTAVNSTVFASYLLPLSGQLDFQLGARLNFYSLTDRAYLSPRASLTYKPTAPLSLSLSGGVYNQFLRSITYNDRFGKSHDFWILAENNRGVLRSFHINLAAQLELPHVTFRLEAYRKNSLNELVQVWLVNGFNNSSVPTANNFRTFGGDGEFIGINFYTRFIREWYELSLSYSLSRNLISVRAIDGGDPFPASNDRRHELSVVNGFSFGSWTLAQVLVYGSGYPYVSSLLINNRDIRDLEVEERIERLPDYFRLDLSANYQFKVWGQNFVAGCSVFNVLNRKNSDQVQYLYNLSDQAANGDDFIVGSEINLLPRTMDISLEWHF